jgi:TetR/AcrR family transcriptional repressor of mexCD-oprJ operon
MTMTPSPQTTPDDERLMASLALALVDKPRATLQELAKAVGVSKATLYRFCKTREELIERLMAHGAVLMHRSLAEARLDEGKPDEVLHRVIQGQLEHRELGAFLTYYWKPDTLQDARWADLWTEFSDALDAFFLRCQRAGYFRIDISAAALTESLIALIVCMMDAERRGRVARAGMSGMVETLFLKGAIA